MIPTNPKTSFVIGRNGGVDIKGIHCWIGGKDSPHCYIDGISAKRGVVVNGGFCIDVETMTAMAKGWLEKQGYKVSDPAETLMFGQLKENVAAIWARLYLDETGDAMELARSMTTEEQRQKALAESEIELE